MIKNLLKNIHKMSLTYDYDDDDLNDVNVKDINGTTKLMYAIQEGNISIVNKLLKKGANVNSKDNNGISCLMHASKLGYIEIIELLSINGANVMNELEDLFIIAKNDNIRSILLKYTCKSIPKDYDYNYDYDYK